MLHKIGICRCKSEGMKYFTQDCISQKIRLDDNLPDIDYIVSSMVDYEIISVDTIKTIKGKSNDEKYSSGKKAVVKIKFKQKIMYISKIQDENVHIFENYFYHSVFVVIPERIEGTDTKALVKFKKLKPIAYIEDIITKNIGVRAILNYIHVLFEIKYIPTYELCYTIHSSFKNSNIFTCFSDGSNNIQNTFYEKEKVMMPKWSQVGKEIAFLCYKKKENQLCILNPQTSFIKTITDKRKFALIKDFCWIDNENIIFSGKIKENFELFSINIRTLNYKQLTFSSKGVENFKPKYLSKYNKIVFLRKENRKNSLWQMDRYDGDCKEINSLFNAKDFCFTIDGNHIASIIKFSTCSCGVVILNLKCHEENMVKIPDGINLVKKISCSPSSNLIAFLGGNCNKDDIYVYNLDKNSLENLTNNNKGIKIKDFTWSPEGDKIYYSSNGLQYYNISGILLSNLEKFQLTNIEAENIELSYRPCIF
ncbi:hypothetical protein ACFIJ5_05510 [Haloimpatiens sp. FM7330]|uniref:hypothetical protein n=1 Tax=Haloimpatiens sp. FM7330 TaxID=3298610 RepID=UPI00363F6954